MVTVGEVELSLLFLLHFELAASCHQCTCGAREDYPWLLAGPTEQTAVVLFTRKKKNGRACLENMIPDFKSVIWGLTEPLALSYKDLINFSKPTFPVMPPCYFTHPSLPLGRSSVGLPALITTFSVTPQLPKHI